MSGKLILKLKPKSTENVVDSNIIVDNPQYHTSAAEVTPTDTVVKTAATSKRTLNLTKKAGGGGNDGDVIGSKSSSSQRMASKRIESNANNNDERRTKIKAKFIAVLGEDLGVQCENCLYQHVYLNNKFTLTDRESDKEYIELGLTLYRNLNPESTIKNTHLLPLVLDGKIKPEDLVKMDPKDMFPTKWNMITEKRIKEILVESKQEVATTDMVECKKCHHRNATYYQLQVRSADEPMTTFFNCINCNNKWSEN